jgi:hypothetical protein
MVVFGGTVVCSGVCSCGFVRGSASNILQFDDGSLQFASHADQPCPKKSMTMRVPTQQPQKALCLLGRKKRLENIMVCGGVRWCMVVYGGVWWCMVVFGGTVVCSGVCSCGYRSRLNISSVKFPERKPKTHSDRVDVLIGRGWRKCDVIAALQETKINGKEDIEAAQTYLEDSGNLDGGMWWCKVMYDGVRWCTVVHGLWGGVVVYGGLLWYHTMWWCKVVYGGARVVGGCGGVWWCMEVYGGVRWCTVVHGVWGGVEVCGGVWRFAVVSYYVVV